MRRLGKEGKKRGEKGCGISKNVGGSRESIGWKTVKEVMRRYTTKWKRAGKGTGYAQF